MSCLNDNGSSRNDDEGRAIKSTSPKYKFFKKIIPLIDINLSIIAYFIISKYTSIILSLSIAATIPAATTIISYILYRQVNIIGSFVMAGFVTKIIVTLFQNDSRIFLLRDSFISGVFGLIFVITLIPIKIGSFKMKPILFYNCKFMEMGNLEGLSEDEPIPERWERYWRYNSTFRQSFIVVTAVLGFGLIFGVLIRVVIIYVTTVDQAILFGTIFSNAWSACLNSFVLGYVVCYKVTQKKDKQLQEQESDAANRDKVLYNRL